MNNIKKLSIILLLSMGVSGTSLGASCDNNSCNTSNNSCNTCDNNSNNSCNTDCNNSNNSCNNTSNCNERNCGSTIFVPRDITGNLTIRNDLSFYNRYHDARCNFFTWDNTFWYEQTQKGRCLGASFLGANSVTVAENGGDIESLNFGLGAASPSAFESTVSLDPRRQVFAWLPQFIFNLDCLCTGFWADVSFAVAHARHKLRFHENNTVPGDITGEPTTVLGALNGLNAFSKDCRHTGVDNVIVRLGYDYTYCNNDHFGLYFLGLIPTGKRFNNARWFEPVIGSKHGGIGVGVEGDYTVWNCDDQDLVFMTELKYTYRFKHSESRVFDLNNGLLSRFLLAAPEANPCLPVNIVSNLTSCVEVKPRSTVDFWLGLHYQWCNWGAEFDYNLYWRQRERVCGNNFNFDNLGLFNLNCGCGTSDSTATIATEFGAGTPDATFTTLTSADVNLRSGEACKALTHTVSGAVSYNNVWCDCYPWYVGIGGKYEFAGKKDRRALPESWGVFGKATISF